MPLASIKAHYYRTDNLSGTRMVTTEGVSNFTLEIEEHLLDGKAPAAGACNDEVLTGQIRYALSNQFDNVTFRFLWFISITVNGHSIPMGA